MNTVLVVSVVVIACCFLVITIFLIVLMLQLKKLADSSQSLLLQLKNDAAIIGKIASNISFMADKVASPWFKVGSAVSSIITSVLVNKFKKDA